MRKRDCLKHARSVRRSCQGRLYAFSGTSPGKSGRCGQKMRETFGRAEGGVVRPAPNTESASTTTVDAQTRRAYRSPALLYARPPETFHQKLGLSAVSFILSVVSGSTLLTTGGQLSVACLSTRPEPVRPATTLPGAPSPWLLTFAPVEARTTGVSNLTYQGPTRGTRHALALKRAKRRRDADFHRHSSSRT